MHTARFWRVLGTLGMLPLHAAGNLLEHLFLKPPRKEGYDSDFLKPSDLLSRYNKGFCLTGNRSLTALDSHANALICGGSGCGKSSTVIIPSILRMARHGHSLVIHDPSRELYTKTAATLGRDGYTVRVLDFADSSRSDGFNPIVRLSDTAQIMKVSSMLVRSVLGSGGNDSFWNNQAASFVAMCIAILKKQPEQYQNLANLKHLIDLYLADNKALDVFVAKTKAPEIVKEYKIFINYDPKVAANIVATARAATNFMADNHIRIITAFDSISFEELRQQKTAIYICNKTADADFYAPLSSIFFELLFGYIMDAVPAKRKTRSIYLVLDELSSLNRLPTLEKGIVNGRKFLSGILLSVQAFEQLEHLYGAPSAQTIRGSCHAKVYFPNQPTATCKELETMLGKFQYTDKAGRTQTRPLLTADEIRTMPKESALLFVGPARACYVSRMKPYYHNLAYMLSTRKPAPDLSGKAPFDSVPLL